MGKSSRSKRKPKGPCLFSTFGKKAQDILGGGYSYNHQLRIATSSDTGWTVTSSMLERRGALASNVKAEYKYKTDNSVISVKLDAPLQTVESKGERTPLTGVVAVRHNYENTTINVKVEMLPLDEKRPKENATLSVSHTLKKSPEVSLSGRVGAQLSEFGMKANNIDKNAAISASVSLKKSPEVRVSRQAGAQRFGCGMNANYIHKNAALSASVSLKRSPEVRLSGTIGIPSFAFGMEVNYKAPYNHFPQYRAGIGMTTKSSEVSVTLTDQSDVLTASYVHKLHPPKRMTVAGEFRRRFSKNTNALTIGGSCAIDKLTTVKLSLSSHGKLGTHVQHEIKPKSFLRISGEFDVKALYKVPKIGLALALTI